LSSIPHALKIHQQPYPSPESHDLTDSESNDLTNTELPKPESYDLPTLETVSQIDSVDTSTVPDSHECRTEGGKVLMSPEQGIL